MSSFSYRRHRFPIDVIQQAVWLYFQFHLSLRNVEDLLAQRGIDVSYETVRRWSVKFGLAYAKTLRKTHPRADVRWHLDEVFVRINGKCVCLWRAVDCEGEVLDVLVQSRRNKHAAIKMMRKLLKSPGFCPTAVVTDKLPSYGAALSDLGMNARTSPAGG
jgi:putative transposase